MPSYLHLPFLKKVISVIILLFFVILSFFIIGILYTRIQSNYTYNMNMFSLQNVYENTFITKIAYTNSVNYRVENILARNENNNDFSLYVFTINEKATTKVLLTGSVHGEEPAGAWALAAIIRQSNDYIQRYPNICFTIIPTMNPWGFVHANRFNSDGINIGVDFSNKKSNEAQAIVKYLSDKKYDLVIDLHQTKTPDSYILIHNKNQINISEEIINKLSSDTFVFSNSPTPKLFKFISNKKGIAYYPNISSIFEKLAHRETLFVMLKNTRQCNNIYAPEISSSIQLFDQVDLAIKIVNGYLDSL